MSWRKRSQELATEGKALRAAGANSGSFQLASMHWPLRRGQSVVTVHERVTTKQIPCAWILLGDLPCSPIRIVAATLPVSRPRKDNPAP
jgi:hypothetical protein